MKVLFICKGNWFRSQMAEAIYNRLTKSNDAISAGTSGEPQGEKISAVMPKEFFDIMKSHGLDLSDKVIKKLTPKMLTDADVAISMAEEPGNPDFLNSNSMVIRWNVPDGGPIEETYQKIAGLVGAFINNSKK